MWIVHVSCAEEKFWIWVKRLEVMRGIRPGSEGVPIYFCQMDVEKEVRRRGWIGGMEVDDGENGEKGGEKGRVVCEGGCGEYHAVCLSTPSLSIYLSTPSIRKTSKHRHGIKGQRISDGKSGKLHAKIQQLYPSKECCKNSSPRTSYNLSCPA